MISIAVSRYGLILWEESGDWRVFGITDARRSSLAGRTRDALEQTDAASRDEARRALLSIGDASLLVDSEYPVCDGDCDGRCDEGDFTAN